MKKIPHPQPHTFQERGAGHRGFTLIELLVVVAIIALLSATILASLASARNKAKSAKIQSELQSLQAQMELYYNDNNFSYVGSSGATTDCGSGPFGTASTAGIDGAQNLIEGIANDITGSPTNYYYMTCAADSSSWAVSADLLETGNAWCVDSNGVSKAAVNSSGQPTNSPINSIGSGPYHCL